MWQQKKLFQPVWWSKRLFPGSFSKLAELLKPTWGFCRNILFPHWRLSSLWLFGHGWYFWEEQEPHKVLKLSSIKALAWASVLHIQNTLFLYLFFPEVFQNHGFFVPLGGVIIAGLKAGGHTYLVGICLHHSAQGILRFATSQSGWDGLIWKLHHSLEGLWSQSCNVKYIISPINAQSPERAEENSTFRMRKEPNKISLYSQRQSAGQEHCMLEECSAHCRMNSASEYMKKSLKNLQKKKFYILELWVNTSDRKNRSM